MHAGQHGGGEQQVGTEPDIGLLADGHEAGVAGQQVPQARERHERIDLGKEAQRLPVAPPGRGGERDDQQREHREPDPARAGRVLDLERAHPCTFGNRPCGRAASTIRNATCPASTCQPGSIWAPIACATPRMMPPTSVPHILPRPPMITASKPKIRRAGPIDGSKLVLIASNTPATATTASESAMARAKTRRLSRPTSCATSWSSDVARNARPIAVR